MKKLAALLLLLIFCTACAYAEDKNGTDGIMREYARLYGEKISEGIDAACGEEYLSELVPSFNVEEILSGLARGENIFSIREICGRGIGLLTGEVRSTLKIMAFILALSVLSTYLVNMQSGFAEGASQAAFFACYSVIAGIAAAAFFEVVKCGQNAVENISVFMRMIVPVVLVSLASGGAVISATAFEAVLVGVIEITEWVIEKAFVPMLMMSAAVNIVNNLSDKINAGKLVQLLNKAVKWGLGIMLTLFVGVTGLQSIASCGADGLTVKVTKFAASNLIPVVGGILSESVETVMNCSIVIKNSVGILGVVVVALIAVIPLAKVAACLIMFRMCAAVIQPIADKKIVKCISELADSVSCVFSMTVAITVMFIIILTIMINVGNSAVMLGR